MGSFSKGLRYAAKPGCPPSLSCGPAASGTQLWRGFRVSFSFNPATNMQTMDASLSGIALILPAAGCRCALLAAFLLAVPVGTHADDAATTTTALPEGTIERRRVEFEAPDVACASYVATFRERVWRINLSSRDAFRDLLARLPLAENRRAALLNPAWWRAVPGGFEVRPAADFLRSLTPAERSALYGVLARWTPNKVERWPLVFAGPAAIARLRTQGHDPALVSLVERSAYPFSGGLAFSDYSLLAEAFPDPARLERFLQDASTVAGFLPRLRIRTALSVSSALAYWTVDNNNPFARPLLEALLHTETDAGTELTALMPGSTRVLSHNIDPEEVPYDSSLMSFIISASLSGTPPRDFASPEEFQQWLEREFVRVAPPYRYGDLMVLERPAGLPVRYACAFVADNFVFAKDPVGLGLWRFMNLDEVLGRNPHFAGGSWVGLRRRTLAQTERVGGVPAFRLGSTGPWGRLRTSPVNLTPPDRWLDQAGIFQPQDTWGFLTRDWTEIEALLRRSQLTADQLAALLDPDLRDTGPGGEIVLHVPPALRRGLSPASRGIIYNHLGLHGTNPLHHVPLVLPSEQSAYALAALNPDLLRTLQQLAYRRNERLCLSDLDLLHGMIRDESEARRLQRLLYHSPALQVELTRESLARPAEVIAYWRKTDGRSITALLRWFERSPGLEAVDAANLLPVIPQQILNTFPDSPAAGHTNCFWTALNFFAREPDNRFLADESGQPPTRNLIEEELAAHYVPVDAPYRFGDVLCLVDPRPQGFGIMHMMNYVADDIVFTKNGYSLLAPTVFMRLPDVRRFYPTMFDLQLRAYRRASAPAR
jgi:hypothetical protein